MCVNAMPVSAPASPAPSVKIGFAAEGRQLQVVARGAECRLCAPKSVDSSIITKTYTPFRTSAWQRCSDSSACWPTRTLRSRASQPSFCLYLLVPLPTFQFALTAADLRRGILQLAHYIEKLATNANHAFRKLGPNGPTDGIAVWDRERWKAKEFSRKCSVLRFLPPSTPDDERRPQCLQGPRSRRSRRSGWPWVLNAGWMGGVVQELNRRTWADPSATQACCGYASALNAAGSTPCPSPRPRPAPPRAPPL